jgi:RNA polymerase sigma-70 factor (ECF subfamily)
MAFRGELARTLDLGRLRERRPEEVRVWFQTYFAVVHGFVRRRVAARPDLADDVTEDAFLVALSHIHEYDPDRGSMLPWLTYIARNCARKALRRARPVGMAEIDLAGAGEGFPVLDPGPLPDELLARAETVDRVHSALAALAPHHQRVLEHYYFLEQPLKQIASAEATTVTAVKSLLHRARLAFMAAFEAGGRSEQPATAGGRSR